MMRLFPVQLCSRRPVPLWLLLALLGAACSGGPEKPAPASCGEDLALCGESCVNLRSDPAHCGACGAACGAGTACVDGACILRCEEGQSACGEACVSLESDPRHCGACDNPCDAGMHCQGGSCVEPCPAGRERCGQTCVDLQSDPLHCGSCDESCAPGLLCEEGDCVCPGRLERCEGACVDTRQDPANCGACGIACPSGASCREGRCLCPEGFTACGGACVHLLSDVAHCGSCHAPCGDGLHATTVCQQGSCRPVCEEGHANCSGEGLDCETHVAQDIENCGACGFRCDRLPGLARVEGCLNGQCVFECEEGLANCSGNPNDGCETDVRFNPRHCWGCGRDCSKLPRVAAASCTETGCRIDACEAPYADCDGDPNNGCEADLRSDRMHCGGCGAVCQTGCTGGACLQVVAFDMAPNHGCASLSNATVWCWGHNSAGQLGNGTANHAAFWSTPARVQSIFGATVLVTAFEHTCALDGEGELWCWGSNRYGQLGRSGPDALSPIAGPSLPPGGAFREKIRSLAIGQEHSCVVLEDGAVWCWGLNDHGQIGVAPVPPAPQVRPHSDTPVRVENLPPVVEIGLGRQHSCARTEAGAVWCWGANDEQQRGDDDAESRHQPIQVQGLPAVTHLAVGYRQNCALDGGGELWCWGKGDTGALGNGVAESSATPVRVRDLPQVVQASCGTDFCCAVQASGALWCWGTNRNGNLGNGSYVSSSVPVRVALETPADRVAAGGPFACARSLGQLWCWGGNAAGQLGSGSLVAQPVPGRVIWPADSILVPELPE